MLQSKTPTLNVTVYQPNQTPSRMTLEGPSVTMGRADDCRLPIKDRYLSRHHAEIAWAEDSWIVKDSGSVNGTFVNGERITVPVRVSPGDRITLGDTELVIEPDAQPEPMSSAQISVSDIASGATISIPMPVIEEEEQRARHVATIDEESSIALTRLAMELLEDKPMSELFEFIVDRVMHVMSPSRCALALLSDDQSSFVSITMKKSDETDSEEMRISRTLLHEVIQEKKVLAFTDVSADENLAQAKSIIGQRIRSAVCAPLFVNNKVLGVLYMDYLLAQRTITESDAKLAGQIARIAGIKLETTRLRDEAQAKQRMEEELRMAYVIQSKLLPDSPPSLEDYTFAGVNRPARGVSGDYFDFFERPDGRVYFVIADVSGKGITAALIMASLATAFNIFTSEDLSPEDLVARVNRTLAPKTSPNKFATLFAGVLDPKEGTVEFVNAGHTPPIVIREGSCETLEETDLVVGLFEGASYRGQKVELRRGDAIIIFTDGIIEAENEAEEELGYEAVCKIVSGWHGRAAPEILDSLENEVRAYAGTRPLGDDVTILSLRRDA
ncbi:MAG: SpoIIE family protein phosphatase [Thermoanaerobaculia bacterium]|nr:SpoIIE family protein phosphatase [Thermoanaerobaculia bacterium]